MRIVNRDSIGRAVAMMAVSACIAAALALIAPCATAQTNPADRKPGDAMAARPAPQVVQTFFLANASDPRNLNNIEANLRDALPGAQFYADETQDAITVRGTQEDINSAHKLIADLDKPRKVYRLTFTITNIDGEKRGAPQQFAFLAVAGEKATFKQGSRVPIVTGTTNGQTATNEVQYLDVGLTIEATISGSPDALLLRSKLEQSSLLDEKPSATMQDPVVGQTALQDASLLMQGKPVVIGSLDIPGTTQREEIAVAAEQVQ